MCSHVVNTILTVRANSGLSGDMILTGLLCMNKTSQEDISSLLSQLNMPELEDCLFLEPHEVHTIGGWHSAITLPHQHEHRTLTDILGIIASSSMSEKAKDYARATFTLLAKAEGRVHNRPQSSVHFHEVGALDSILDICLSCILFAELAPTRFVCSPLPLADGQIRCEHGILPSPSPAVLELLQGIPVHGFSGRGETVTPTAIALLRALNADFGPWPAMYIEERCIAYGDKVFENAPNGAIWAYGKACIPVKIQSLRYKNCGDHGHHGHGHDHSHVDGHSHHNEQHHES